jgi:hypothetical protein
MDIVRGKEDSMAVMLDRLEPSSTQQALQARLPDHVSDQALVEQSCWHMRRGSDPTPERAAIASVCFPQSCKGVT